MPRQIRRDEKTGDLILPYDNPHKGVGRRIDNYTVGPVSGRKRRRTSGLMTPEQLNEMYTLNGIQSGEFLSDGVAVGPTYDDHTLNQRITSGYYNDLDTPEEMLTRVREKLALSNDLDGQRIGNSIIETMKLEGLHGLTLEQLNWIPKAQTYAARRAALEAKIAPKLATFAKQFEAENPELAKEIDDDFAAMLDHGGRGKTPTTRPGLFKKLINWMWGKEQEEPVMIEIVEPEKVLVK